MAQNNRPSAGDLTGRQKQQQQREQREATQQRAAEMSMSNAAQTDEELNGLFDPQSGERLDAPPPSRVASVVESPPPSGFPRPEASEPVYTGQEDEDPTPPVLVTKRSFSPLPPEAVRSTTATIRVDMDIDDMTYGMKNGEPNNFTFKEGLAYRVPVAVAEHLNERGLVRQWISS